MPYDLRLKAFEKQQTKSQSKAKSNSSEISVGSIVSLKSLPIFNTGTFGMTVREGQPFVGQLTEHVFSYRENKAYKFKVKKASSFLTEQNSTPTSPTLTSPQTQVIQGSLKRKKQYLNQENKKVNLDESRDESDFEREEREENWLLSDVFFMDDAKACNVLGQVIKIDSDYALVRMSDSKTESDPLENTRIFAKSQLQLAEASNFSLKSNCDQFVQKGPKKIPDLTNVLTCCAQQGFIHVIISKENSIVYAQYDLASGKFLKEKKFPTNCVSAFCGNNLNNISLRTIDEPNFNMFTLFDGNSTIYPFTNLHGSNTLKDPEWKNLFPFKSFAQTVLIPVKSASTTSANQTKKIHFVTLFSMKIEQLMASILRCDLNRVFKILRQLENDLSQLGTNALSKRLKRIINERCDGNRNIIHAAVYCCSPISNNQLNISSNLGDIKSAAPSDPADSYSCAHPSTKIERPWSVSFQSQGAKSDKKINMSLPSMQMQSSLGCEAANACQPGSTTVPFWPPPPPPPQTPSAEAKANTTQIFGAVKLSEKDKIESSLKILNLLLNSSVINGKLVSHGAKKPPTDANINYLLDLLTHRNSNGETPFMYAVSVRAYDAALLILDVALRVRVDITKSLLDKRDKEANFYHRDLLFTNVIYPVGSRADQSPLFVLCANDTCSFTWTGDNHITQDIFECRTCSLVGNLCCCSECARTCHKGHECRVKKSSPTAYCDCWEKCKCKSLIGGDQDKRFELFDKLLKHTNLLFNSTNQSGQHLLLTLIETCGRQLHEQKNYRRHTGNSSVSSASSSASSNQHRGKRAQVGEMPQHDLEPPKFSLKALGRIFADFDSLKQIFVLGDAKATSGHANFTATVDHSLYVDEQSSCHDLDKFVYCLVHKCPSQLLLTLVDSLRTVLSASNEQSDKLAECKRVVQRLVNSACRLFVVLCMETSPAALNLSLDCTLANKLIRQSARAADNQVKSLVNVSAVTKCQFVFKEFVHVACVELAEAAKSLITPVILGTVRPTSFKLGHGTQPSSATANLTEFSSHVHTGSLCEQMFNGEVSGQKQSSSSSSSTSLVLPLGEISVESGGQAAVGMLCDGEEANDADNDVEDDDDDDDDVKWTSEQQGDDGGDQDDNDDDDDDEDDDDDFFKGEQRIKLDEVESDVMDDDDVDDDADERVESDQDEDNDELDEENDECDFELSIADDKKQSDKKSVDKPKINMPISTRTNRINSHVNSLIQQYGAANSALGAAANTANTATEYTFYSTHSADSSSQSSSTLTTSNLAINNNTSATTPATTSAGSETKACAQNTPSTVQITKNTLSRVFSILVKQVRDLLNSLGPNGEHQQQQQQLKSSVDDILMPAFDWMSSIMESSEAQLRFATAFTSIQLNASDSTDYLRHLEQKTLLNNYYTNNSLLFAAANTTTATNATTTTTANSSTSSSVLNTSAPASHYSTRFGSGIDARRKLNIMQHQHQTNASTIQQQQQQQKQHTNSHSQLITSQRDFIAYTVSLMRQHTNEHRDSIPHTDIAQLKHVAYVLDAFLFYLRHDLDLDRDLDLNAPLKTRSGDRDYDSSSSSSSSSSDSSDDDHDLDLEQTAHTRSPRSDTYRKSRFFKRSKSAKCVGARSPDPFHEPIVDSVPLAAKPHLLQPHSRIQDMFKCAQTNNEVSSRDFRSSIDRHRRRGRRHRYNTSRDQNKLSKFHRSLLDLTKSKSSSGHRAEGRKKWHCLLNKWRLTSDLFGRVFCDDIGAETGSTLRQMAGFQLKEAKFRREMERVKNMASRELIMEVERERDKLLYSTFKSLNNTYSLQCSRRVANSATMPPPLCLSRVKVTFKDEQGEGSGV
ncbi:E3 ubiquitin- ligase UBR5-like, partial [Brachionus plicatilis]